MSSNKHEQAIQEQAARKDNACSCGSSLRFFVVTAVLATLFYGAIYQLTKGDGRVQIEWVHPFKKHGWYGRSPAMPKEDAEWWIKHLKENPNNRYYEIVKPLY